MQSGNSKHSKNNKKNEKSTHYPKSQNGTGNLRDANIIRPNVFLSVVTSFNEVKYLWLCTLINTSQFDSAETDWSISVLKECDFRSNFSVLIRTLEGVPCASQGAILRNYVALCIVDEYLNTSQIVPFSIILPRCAPCENTDFGDLKVSSNKVSAPLGLWRS